MFFFFSPTPTSPIRSKISLSCVIVYVSITVKVAKTGCSPPQWPPPVRIDWLNCHFMKFVSLRRCAWKFVFSSSPFLWGGSVRWVGRGFLGLGGSPRVVPSDLCLCARWLTICSIKYIKLCAALRRPLNLIDLWRTAAREPYKNKAKVSEWGLVFQANPRADIKIAD